MTEVILIAILIVLLIALLSERAQNGTGYAAGDRKPIAEWNPPPKGAALGADWPRKDGLVVRFTSPNVPPEVLRAKVLHFVAPSCKVAKVDFEVVE